jgi:D-alanyl-D-alanine carboxypeptidase
MRARCLAVAVLGAAVTLTSVAAAERSATSLPPPVARIARELAGSGNKVIVAVYAGGKQYVATAGKPRPKPFQRFRVGSLTKAFTATIALQLVDEGKLRLSETLEEHLPGVVPRGTEITIYHLLQDRSGLVSYTNYTSWLKDASRSPETRPIDLLRFAASKPLLFDPGSRSNYSNTDWLALGLVVEAVTGNSWADELERRIIRPLGLAATEQPKARLLPDLGDDGKLPVIPGVPKNDPVYDVDWANPVVSWAGGGIVSNARDISRFFSALLAGRLLSGASLAKMKKSYAHRPRSVQRARDRRKGHSVWTIVG